MNNWTITFQVLMIIFTVNLLLQMYLKASAHYEYINRSKDGRKNEFAIKFFSSNNYSIAFLMLPFIPLEVGKTKEGEEFFEYLKKRNNILRISLLLFVLMLIFFAVRIILN